MNQSPGRTAPAVVVTAALLAAAFWLSGCGSVSSTGEGVSTNQPLASGGPAAPDADQPSQVPAAAASAAFTARADLVAQAVRAAGMATPAPVSTIFLESSGTPGLGFDTADQKEAWGAGKVSLAPGTAGRPSGPSVITLRSGRTIPVEVMSAQAALDAQLATSTGDCSGVPAASCRLTLTAGVLTTATVTTSAGDATVPVWSFTAQGLSQPIVVVAVSTRQLPTQPLERPVPPGLSAVGPGFTGVQGVSEGPGGTLVATLSHGDCDTDLRGQVVEYDELVVVGGTYTPPPPDTVCTAALRMGATTLSLSRPLGQRVVVSAVDGSVLRLSAP